ncbi:MAG: hypothetical protein LUC43_03555 [Burkholderiales bacterium]|nr:hypothetical protein [Burkholderiales bacterium]
MYGAKAILIKISKFVALFELNRLTLDFRKLSVIAIFRLFGLLISKDAVDLGNGFISGEKKLRRLDFDLKVQTSRSEA